MKQKDLLLIILVLLMVGAVKLFRRSQVIINPDTKELQPFYEHFDSPNSFSFPPDDFADIKQIVVDNPAGTLTFLPAENGVVTVQSTLVIFHPSEKMVEAFRKGIHVVTKMGSGGVLNVLVTGAQEGYEGRFQVNHTIWLPGGILLDASTRYGNVEVADVAATLKLKHRAGDVRISELVGKIDIEADHSQLVLTNISGEMFVKLQNSGLTVQNADRLGLVPRRCQLDLSGIREKLVVNQALLNRVKVDKASEVEISGSGNEIFLSNISQSVRISNEFEDINLENVSGEISVQSKRSRIKLNRIEVRKLYIKNSFRDTQVMQASFETAQFDLHQSDLELSLLGIGSELIVQGAHSDITLNVPENLDFSVDFVTRMGRIIHQPDASFTESEERGRQILFRQSPGSIKMRVLTSYGDITLNPIKKIPD